MESALIQPKEHSAQIIQTMSGTYGIIRFKETFTIKDKKYRDKVLFRELDNEFKETGRLMMVDPDRFDHIEYID